MKGDHKIANMETPQIGILEWFRPGEYKRVEQSIQDLRKLGVKHLRTGISWADWHLEGTPEWYDWLLPKLAENLEILPCLLYTPPSMGEVAKTSSPPTNLKAYADFLDTILKRYGDHFEWVELWNEPNNRLEYDFTLDYSWEKFATMIKMASYWAKQCNKKTLLGGMSPIDPNWLQMMFEKGAMEYIDAVGIHGFPDVFDQQWPGWDESIAPVQKLLEKKNANHIEIWISEAGFSTWQHDEMKQYEEMRKILKAKVSRIYWYSLYDLDPIHATVGGYHLDEREYNFGLKRCDGTEKLLFKLWSQGALVNPQLFTHIQKQYQVSPHSKYILITGGAGFIGTNLAKHFLGQGYYVMVYDNLFRSGVEKNLAWLKKHYPERLLIQVADIYEEKILRESVNHALAVFHFSAQVAVTASLQNPNHDFEVNMKGTFQLLEAIRLSPNKPPVIFTSTNKVYGNLPDINLEVSDTRYIPTEEKYKIFGIDEGRNLEFHSPYGCSKGAADQYILDYSRSFGLKTLVFRMSCIYGPHQFGTEDQGWVAHFLISALEGKPITIFGDGKQVRDVLYVDDLIAAFELALQNMATVNGKVFNIGGGPSNTVSLLEILHQIREETGIKPQISFEDARIGDQKYYVTDIRSFGKATGWEPSFSIELGLKRMLEWYSGKNVSSFENQKKTILG